MAKGAIAKVDIGNQIIGLFGEDAFWNGEGKEIRINTKENGEPVQVKIAFTVAKVAVEPGDAEAVPGVVKSPASAVIVGDGPSFPEPKEVKVTEDEQAAVANLMASLGL